MLLKLLSRGSSDKEGDPLLRGLRNAISSISARIQNLFPRMLDSAAPLSQKDRSDG